MCLVIDGDRLTRERDRQTREKKKDTSFYCKMNNPCKIQDIKTIYDWDGGKSKSRPSNQCYSLS